LYRSYDSGDLTEVPPEFTEPKWLARPLEEDEATNQSGRAHHRAARGGWLWSASGGDSGALGSSSAANGDFDSSPLMVRYGIAR
jgi:hypothetical protein